MAVDTKETIDHLNDLLRGEISAVETYTRGIDKMDHSQDLQFALADLRQIKEEHGRTAQRIRERIRSLGGEADNDSGLWGTWANLVQNTANLFGDKSSLKALKEGEEHGLKDYERTLDEDIPAETRAFLQELMAQQRGHLATLDRLIAMK